MLAHKLSATLLCALGATVVAPHADAFLLTYYDPATGEVLFETPATGIGSDVGFDTYQLEINQPLFNLDNWIELLPNNFLPDSNTTSLKFENALGLQLTGLYTIGEILPAGLTESEMNALWIPGDATTGTGSLARGGLGFLGTGLQPLSFIYGDAPGEPINEPLAPTAQSADFIYDFTTGEVTLKSDDPELGGTMNGIFFQSDGAFQSENFINIFPDGLDTINDSVLATTGSPIDPGEYEIGAVLEPGLTLAELESTVFDARFFGDGGIPIFNTRGTEDGTAFTFIVVPEPATGMLAALGGLLVAARRRRS